MYICVYVHVYGGACVNLPNHPRLPPRLIPQIIIWDGLTLRAERSIEDVNVGGLVLGPDCLLVSSFKVRVGPSVGPGRRPLCPAGRDDGRHAAFLQGEEP